MTLDDIPADETLTMTAQMDRLFRIADCAPTCHCCTEPIKVGELFKLATCEVLRFTGASTPKKTKLEDIMLCGNCDRDDLKRMQRNKMARVAKWRRDNPRAGYSRPTRKCK